MVSLGGYFRISSFGTYSGSRRFMIFPFPRNANISAKLFSVHKLFSSLRVFFDTQDNILCCFAVIVMIFPQIIFTVSSTYGEFITSINITEFLGRHSITVLKI